MWFELPEDTDKLIPEEGKPIFFFLNNGQNGLRDVNTRNFMRNVFELLFASILILPSDEGISGTTQG